MPVNETFSPPPNNPLMEPVWDRIDAELVRRGWTWSTLGRTIGATDQRMNNWKRRGVPANQHKAIADALGWSIDQLLSDRWMPNQHAPEGRATAGPIPSLAQQLSYPLGSIDTPVVAMESVRMGEVKEHFALVIEDDALDPSYPKGTVGEFSRDRQPIAGKPVLLRDKDGNVFIRRYEVRTPTHWVATSLNPGFQPLDSVRDGLVVLATMTGHRW